MSSGSTILIELANWLVRLSWQLIRTKWQYSICLSKVGHCNNGITKWYTNNLGFLGWGMIFGYSLRLWKVLSLVWFLTISRWCFLNWLKCVLGYKCFLTVKLINFWGFWNLLGLLLTTGVVKKVIPNFVCTRRKFDLGWWGRMSLRVEGSK
jgi:hypothetical protein